MSDPLAPQYDPAAIEADLYRRWLAADLFRADARDPGARYVVMMPPPNVTAVLHVGHGLNNTVQDVIIRWRRMCGEEALWVPGTDHAGIATQNVIEKQLAGEGKTRFDLGRDAFVERTTGFVTETGGTILDQLRAIGASCDWTRTAYTLSPELSRAGHALPKSKPGLPQSQLRPLRQISRSRRMAESQLLRARIAAGSCRRT